MKRNTLGREKKVLDRRFTAISKLMDSFAHANEDFRGNHSILLSSGSEDDDHPVKKEEGLHNNNCAATSSKSGIPNFTICDRVSSCPYPSAAEEKSLRSLSISKANPPSSYGCSTPELGNVSMKKKQKSKASTSVKNNGIEQENGDGGRNRFYVSDDVLKSFVTFWKEACREHNVYEVMQKMFQFYDISSQQKKKIKMLLSSYPCLVLLNVAVTSIKNGMWDSIYDAFQESGQQGIFDLDADNSPKFEMIEIDVGDKNSYFQRSPENIGLVPVEDLISKISMYLEQGHCVQSEDKQANENQFILLRRFCQFQDWLAEQFSVKDFKDLGHGDVCTFMEKYSSFFPKELHQLLAGDYFQQSPIEVSMNQQQLTLFLSQTSRSIWEDKDTIRKKVTSLLSRQFPIPCFNIKKLGVEPCVTNFTDKNKHVVVNNVLFSSALIGFHCSEKSISENITLEVPNVIIRDSQKTLLNVAVTSKDAMRVLCKAPMLADLMSWSHWDLIFAPVLGSLVQWLLMEVASTDLLCLVTKDGKIIRIDNNASMDSFLEASLQGSSYRTAVELLSLFSLFGGVENVPFALLRNHASHIFEVILRNHVDKVEITGINSDIIRHGQRYVLENEMAACSLSRFFIEILKYLPSEFRVFAADVLLPGLESVVRGAASVILSECKSIEDRIMLHDIGISLYIAEWIDDFHAITSASDTSSVASSIYLSNSPSKIRNSEPSSEPGSIKYTHSDPTFSKTNENCDKMNVVNENPIKIDAGGLTYTEINSDSTHLIESIRHEEFGLDPIQSAAHNTMLEKQHARLGRALQCLSRELYSQDSHFLLELVQNADDNVYPDNVERTLGFILRDNGIVVLNNERGFSAQNIRALCDVGSSTKKGSGAGYIGHKGIGFKSVFRVTDAPEIHSNGYNFKFDISEGQIGFVLPTVVPSVDIKYLVNLIRDSENEETPVMNNIWNTCIVLPFKPMTSIVNAVSNIISMFSDLHPSLLLFLHRLQCIRFRNMISNSFVLMRKEVLGDGIIQVSSGKEKMTWIVASKKLQNTILRPEVNMTEISIAFTLDVTEDGNYIPNLKQQPVFAFLPLRNYGMKFILQGDFVLPSSREEVDVNSPWNQWLLSEFPALFVTAEKSFCSVPFFTGYLGKAVTTYMSYIPLSSEVHGFFSCLPHMIISKLRLSNCMLLEGEKEKWVPPCIVVRNWDENAYHILPPKLLYEHLGLGFLHKDIVLSDPVANALGIESYGPRILVRFLESLCSTAGGLSSMGILWLCSWISALYSAMMAFSGQRYTMFSTGLESDDIISSLKRIPFIPLSDGTYGSADSEKIWYCDDSGTSQNNSCLEYFPNLGSKLRIVDPSLFLEAKKCSASSDTCGDHIIQMIQKLGIQQLTAHDILKVHIMSIFSSNILLDEDVDLTVEYLTFTMFHLQSGCSLCHDEGGSIISDLRNNALIFTNYGCIRITEAPIHFGTEYGNCVNVDNFSCLRKMEWKWHVVDTAYLKHPINKLLKFSVSSWRDFFNEVGITDFVRVVQVEKSLAELPTHLVKNIMGDDLIFHDLVAKDWESSELTHLLSSISRNHAMDESKLILEVLDKLWDDCFSDKVFGYCKLKSNNVKHFRSSFINDVCNIRWVASTLAKELHCPKDLFYECDDVSSVLGRYAPYAIHRVQNLKLVNDIGFKTHVCLNDALVIIDLWRTSGVPFKTSTAQMSKFYSFIWKEMTILKDKMDNMPPWFSSGPFIFIPLEFGCSQDDVVSGLFESADQVFWRDSTGSMDKIKYIRRHDIDFPLNKTLHQIYPDLHDFFVIKCRVKESPSFHAYVEFLLQLSNLTLPSQAKNVVTDILHYWANEVNLGLLGCENINYLKESLQNAEFRIFPTVLDRWVSLHPTFGLICWADCNDLKKEFKHMENIDFLNIGEPNDATLSSDTKFFNVMKLLEIPILSEVVTRVAIFDRITDSDSMTSIVNFCLPYAQRYIYSLHPEIYSQHENLWCNVVDGLQVIVVEHLHYRNVINRHGITSKKKFECAALLQDKILYTRHNCDMHTLFLELSKLFFPRLELHFANFLHMITTMMESGSGEEQTEFFILNSQKVPKLPYSEPVWSISCKSHDQPTPTIGTISHKKPKRMPGINSNWPPLDWKTVPGFGSDVSNQFRTYPSQLPHSNATHSPTPCYPLQPYPSLEKRHSNSENVFDPAETSLATITESATFTSPGNPHSLPVAYDEHGHHHSSDVAGKEEFLVEEQLVCGSSVPKHAFITGRMGEMLAFDYFSSCSGERGVRWVNSDAETGLPYDIIIGNGETGMEFVEVKSTKSSKKNWFIITAREWQFALDKGDSFSIAHILLSSLNCVLKIRILKNPAMLIQQGMLRMVMMMPSHTDDDNPPGRDMNEQQHNMQLHLSS